MAPSYLSAEQVKSFHDNGFLVIEKFWEDNTITELREEISRVISTIDLTASRSIFTTNNNMEGGTVTIHFDIVMKSPQ